MILSRKSREQLRKGIVKAYTEDDLVMLLNEKMDIDFQAIAQGKTYNNRVFYLLGYLESKNRLNEFVETIRKDKPNSPYLQDSLEYINTYPQAQFSKKILLNLIPLLVKIKRLGWAEYKPVTLGAELNNGDQIFPDTEERVRVLCPDLQEAWFEVGVPRVWHSEALNILAFFWHTVP
jgi:hypothetical protein